MVLQRLDAKCWVVCGSSRSTYPHARLALLSACRKVRRLCLCSPPVAGCSCERHLAVERNWCAVHGLATRGFASAKRVLLGERRRWQRWLEAVQSLDPLRVHVRSTSAYLPGQGGDKTRRASVTTAHPHRRHTLAVKTRGTADTASSNSRSDRVSGGRVGGPRAPYWRKNSSLLCHSAMPACSPSAIRYACTHAPIRAR